MPCPKVSIQIPTYNQAKFIDMAIKSCMQQSYANLEIVIADDCSTDNTKDIIQKYLQDDRVKYYCNKANIGRVANYRKALYEYTTGEWVLNLDGDDYFINNDYIKDAVEEIDLTTPSSVLFYQGVHVFETIKKEQFPNHDIRVISAKNYVISFFSLPPFSHLSILYHKQSAINSGFYDRDIISADIYSFLKLAINQPEKKIILSKAISGIWLQHENNTSKSLKLKPHLRNFYLYIQLFFQQIKSGNFFFFSSLYWLFNAFFNYWIYWFKKNIHEFTGRPLS